MARSHSFEKVPCLAVVDDFKNVKLYDYPCIQPGAVDKCYKGHAGFVSNVRFNRDDTFLVTAGGDDKCIFVWGTDITEELRRRSALMPNANALDVGDETDDSDTEGNGKPTNSRQSESIDRSFKVPTKTIDASPVQLIATGGDEFAAVKPWKSAIRAPTDWKEPSGEILGTAPDASLDLKFVYGYRGWDCRNNIGFGDNNFNIIYHIAGVGVMYNSQTHVQVHNVEHDGMYL